MEIRGLHGADGKSLGAAAPGCRSAVGEVCQ